MMTVLGLGFVSIPPAKAQFVIASWDYPDEYSQGISGMSFYENSTGAWETALFYIDGVWIDYLTYYHSGYEINWTAGVCMKLRVNAFFNITLTGATDEADGQNYLQHNVTVSNAGTTVFSQQNFTYYDVNSLDDMSLYSYEVILNFLPESGLIYVVTITYEVFYFAG